MTFEEWSKEYFGVGILPAKAFQDAWNAGKREGLLEASVIAANMRSYDGLDIAHDLKYMAKEIK